QPARHSTKSEFLLCRGPFGWVGYRSFLRGPAFLDGRDDGCLAFRAQLTLGLCSSSRTRFSFLGRPPFPLGFRNRLPAGRAHPPPPALFRRMWFRNLGGCTDQHRAKLRYLGVDSTFLFLKAEYSRVHNFSRQFW